MKLIILLILSASLTAQTIVRDTMVAHKTANIGSYQTTSEVSPVIRGISFGSLLLSGLADGITETITHHWSDAYSWAHKNPAFWNPKVSWVNKWQIDDQGEIVGERFKGSSTVFVMTTDGYHLTRFSNRLFLVTGITVNLSQPRRNWKHYVAEAAASMLVRSVGFHITYK